jgi:hypothetical protein
MILAACVRGAGDDGLGKDAPSPLLDVAPAREALYDTRFAKSSESARPPRAGLRPRDAFGFCAAAIAPAEVRMEVLPCVFCCH